MSKRDLSKLAESSPLSSDTILPAQKLIPRSIRFSEDDEAEIDRIDEYLRERGLLRTDATKIVRLALKAAFRDVDDEQLREFHQEIQIKHARGRKSTLVT
jgi:hypothetical protein